MSIRDVVVEEDEEYDEFAIYDRGELPLEQLPHLDNSMPIIQSNQNTEEENILEEGDEQFVAAEMTCIGEILGLT